MTLAEVDLVINCFDRTVEAVTSPGFFPRVAGENAGFAFAMRTLLINNVSDLPTAVERAERLQKTGEIDRYVVVAERLDAALRATGVTRRDLGGFLHYADCSLVALCLDGPEWLCYWDADVTLRAPSAWIHRALQVMIESPQILTATPQWDHPDGTGRTALVEADIVIDDVAVSYGFSDQLYLVRRSDFRHPALRKPFLRRPLWLWSPASVHLPTTAGVVFEAMMDAYGRRMHRPRATILTATFTIAASNAYEPTSVRERFRSRRQRLILRLLQKVHLKNPRFRLPL